MAPGIPIHRRPRVHGNDAALLQREHRRAQIRGRGNPNLVAAWVVSGWWLVAGGWWLVVGAEGLTGRDKTKDRGLWTAVFPCPALQDVS